MSVVTYGLAVIGGVTLFVFVLLIVAGWTEVRRDRVVDERVRRRYTGRAE